MLRRWQLANFKPIHQRVDLELGDVTVLAGLNSSGKSSVLQSILLVSQTLANQVLDRPLVLNGHVVQLGTFSMVHNERSDSSPLEIGFALDFPESRVRPSGIPSTSYRRPVSRLGGLLRSVSVSASFTSGSHTATQAGTIDAVRVNLRHSVVTAEGDFSPINRREYSYSAPYSPEEPPVFDRLTVDVTMLTQEQENEYLEGVTDEYTSRVPYPAGSNFLATLQTDVLPMFGEPRLLVRLAHFLPGRLMGKFDIRDRQKLELTRALRLLVSADTVTERRTLERRYSAETVLDRRIPRGAVSEMLRMAELDHPAPVFDEGTASELVEWAWKALPKKSDRQRFASILADEMLTALYLAEEDAALEDAGYGIEIYRGALTSGIIDAITEETTSFFTSMLRYLGPLRADPRASQGFGPSSEADDVGPKGEYAAYVYDLNRQRRITWWHPERDKVVTGSLRDAVDFWVRHLGVAHGVSTEEAGLSGFSWMIQTRPGSPDRPLPAVGVGVSQVLPILVAGLLAPEGALLLFEQPELHLHARAQARLADFFLGLARAGKQCIVETHSDCLVMQHRYHIARRSILPTNIQIYFAKQDNDTGDTSFESVQVSPSGNIINWPEGFFDEGLLLEDRIAHEALKTRRTSNQL